MQIMAGRREPQVKLEGGKVARSDPSRGIINPAPTSMVSRPCTTALRMQGGCWDLQAVGPLPLAGSGWGSRSSLTAGGSC